MAINSVPLGQSGTGSAFVLGENTAAQQFNKQYSLAQEKERLAQEKAAQALAESYRNNALAAGDGKLFAKQLSDIEQKHINQGLEYAKQGFDIYRPDPNKPDQVAASQQYMTDRAAIKARQNFGKQLENQYNSAIKSIQSSPLGTYRNDDIKAINDFPANLDLEQAYRSNTVFPELRKNFNEANAIKGIRAATDTDKRVVNGNVVETKKMNVPKTEQAILSAIGSQPEGQQYIKEVTRGVPIARIKQLPKTKEEIAKQVEADVNGSSKAEKEQLAAMGIIKGTPRYEQYIAQSVEDLYKAKQGYDGLMERGIGMASSGLNEMNKVTPQMTPYQIESLRLQKQRLALARQKQSGDGTKDDGVLYRRQWVEDMLNGVPDSGEQLKDIMRVIGGYDNAAISSMIRSFDNPNLIGFRIPSRGNVKKRTVIIDKTNPNAGVQLNQLLNDVTKENISTSKFITQNASGKIKSNTPQPSRTLTADELIKKYSKK